MTISKRSSDAARMEARKAEEAEYTALYWKERAELAEAEVERLRSAAESLGMMLTACRERREEAEAVVERLQGTPCNLCGQTTCAH